MGRNEKIIPKVKGKIKKVFKKKEDFDPAASMYHSSRKVETDAKGNVVGSSSFKRKGETGKATRTKGKLKPTADSAAATKAKTGFEYKRLPGNKEKVNIELLKNDGDVKAVGPDGSPLERSSSFKLRGGTGKMDSYAAFQRQGLISPMHVEDPPKKKSYDIFSMPNDMRYRLEQKGSFSPKVLAAFANHPKAKDYGAYKAGRDKDVARRKVADAETQAEGTYDKEHVYRTDQEKHYGQNDEYKQQTQKAGVVFDSKGSQVYPGQEGHTEGYLKQKAEGHGVTKDVLVKRL